MIDILKRLLSNNLEKFRNKKQILKTSQKIVDILHKVRGQLVYIIYI